MNPNVRSLRWVVAGLLFLSTGINYLDRQTLAILAATIQAELRIDDLGYATITSYFLLSYTVMYAVSGGLVDFQGPRRHLALAVSGWSVASMLHGAVGSATHVEMMRFLPGGFEPANLGGVPEIVSQHDIAWVCGRDTYSAIILAFGVFPLLACFALKIQSGARGEIPAPQEAGWAAGGGV